MSTGSPLMYRSAACFRWVKAWRRSFASAVLAISMPFTLELAFAPGCDVDLELVLPNGRKELLDRGALTHREVLVCFPIG